MKERGILFSSPMILALLAGKKTQTRRILKSPHVDDAEIWAYDEKRGMWASGLGTGAPGSYGHGEYVRCPYGVPGDRLWCRETWRCFGGREYEYQREPDALIYKATDFGTAGDGDGWRPSIFMPRWASRITLEVTGVRVERLHDITEDDAKAEGVEGGSVESAAEKYAQLWCEINGAESWDANVWVWVVSFKRVDAAARAA